MRDERKHLDLYILNKFKTKFSGKLTLTCVSDEETLDRGEVGGLLTMSLKYLVIVALTENPQVPLRLDMAKKDYYG